MVVGVGDVDVARTIDRHPTRAVEARVSTVAIAVTGIGAVAACQGAHVAARRNLAERVVASIRDVDVARAVNGDPIRRRKLGVASHPIQTARASWTTCQSSHRAGARDFADHVIQRIGDIKIALRIQRHRQRPVVGRNQRSRRTRGDGKSG